MTHMPHVFPVFSPCSPPIHNNTSRIHYIYALYPPYALHCPHKVEMCDPSVPLSEAVQDTDLIRLDKVRLSRAYLAPF